MESSIDLAFALHLTVPEAQYTGSLSDNSIKSYDSIIWSDKREKPDYNTLDLAWNKWINEKSYIEKRRNEYPEWRDQLDMIYHDFDNWKAFIKSIKDKYPKGE